MELQTAKGVRDIPSEEKIVKNKVVDTLKEVFEKYGFSPLETPILERYENLAAKFAAGEESDALKETFQLTDQGKRKLGLRFDLTVPLSRYIAMNPQLKMPFKRYEMGIVFRDGPIKIGRYREFTQMDIDTIGTNSMLADAEILATVQESFKQLKLDIIIKINNRKLLNGVLKQAGIKESEEAIIAIDKLDKIGKEGVVKELTERGYKNQQIETVFSLIKEGITLKQLNGKITDIEGKEGLVELEELFNYLTEMNVSQAVFDISLARGLAYYTGTAFEVFLKERAITSSLAGGGRYDKMIGGFAGGNREVPAVGISFGVATIMDALILKDKQIRKTVAQVYVIPIRTLTASLKIVQQLREKGIKADFDLTQRGMSKNLDYASALGIPYVLIIGEKELKEKKVLLRDMSSGEQNLLTINEVVSKLR